MKFATLIEGPGDPQLLIYGSREANRTDMDNDCPDSVVESPLRLEDMTAAVHIEWLDEYAMEHDICIVCRMVRG